jgi:hypothetical protein
VELGHLRDIERSLRCQCEALDPDAVVLADVLALFRTLESVARLADGAKLRLARKVEEAGCHRVDGSRDAAEFLAKATGTTVTAARDALATSKRLSGQAATDAALATGQVSVDQATAVSDAAAADPDAERALLGTARRDTLRRLRDRCATTKANAHPDPTARRAAIHHARTCRTWTDAEGAWNLAMRHLPEVGAEIEALLAPHTHARHEAARRAGAHESRDAYRADALLDLARAANASGTTKPKGASRADTKVFVHIDLDTLLRGSTEPGSTCHIDGVGPVDANHVRSLLGDAFVAALIEDAVDVRSIVHLGRQVTAHQRSALEARGYRCEVPGCDVNWGLEIDHVEDWALTGVTRLDDLAWHCRHHHDQKTHHGHRLAGPPGHRTWTAPDGRHRRDHPPPTERDGGADDQPDPDPTLFADPSAA